MRGPLICGGKGAFAAVLPAVNAPATIGPPVSRNPLIKPSVKALIVPGFAAFV